MARFELSLANGEKILVDHTAGSMAEILTEVDGNGFLLLSEVSGGSSTAREVIVASGQITLIRLLGDRSMQGSDFRPKR
jgi:hypothetical protein